MTKKTCFQLLTVISILGIFYVFSPMRLRPVWEDAHNACHRTDAKARAPEGIAEKCPPRQASPFVRRRFADR